MKRRATVGVGIGVALAGLGAGLWALGGDAATTRVVLKHGTTTAAAEQPTAAPERLPATELPPGDVPDRVSEVAALAERDPAGATQRALALSDAEGRLSALHESFPHWLARDREAAMAWLLLQLANMPLEAAEQLIRDCAALDPQLALTAARQLGVGARPRGVREVFVQWAGREPEAAARAAEQLLEMDGQVRTLGEVARIWAESDPGAAQRWAAALATPALRREAEFAIVQSWSERDPARAARALSELADEGYQQRLIDTVATTWSARDASAARRWVETLATPEQRQAGATALLTVLLEREPARAAGWALELGGGASSDVMEKTLTSWVARDPRAAMTWASRQPESAGRTQLLAIASARYQAQDAQAAAEWLASQRAPKTGE